MLSNCVNNPSFVDTDIGAEAKDPYWYYFKYFIFLLAVLTNYLYVSIQREI